MKDKKILVIGMGRSGKAAVTALLDAGAVVSIQDGKSADTIEAYFLQYMNDKNVKQYFGVKPKDMSVFDMLVLSPGVPPTLDFIEEAKAGGAEIIGELELAYRFCKGKFIAITGTNGKTTTTTLVGEIFKAAGLSTCVGGNIGKAIADEARAASEDTWMVTETSSFQLETIARFKPEVSAILNLTPDHMDRHKSMANYAHAKAAVFMNQTADQYCVLNFDDKVCFGMAEKENCRATVVPFSRKEELEFGAFVSAGEILIRDKDGRKISICKQDELLIPGTHNLENALAAAAIAYFAGIEAKIIADVMREFAGVAHRIELCCEKNGVRFVNDSKGTNTDAAIKAIEAMKENIILIAGGYDKGSTYDEFIESFDGKVKHLILMGETAPKIRTTAEKAGFLNISEAANMEECVEKAYYIAEPGDVVLLSPACASWDMYDNFEQRGDHFKTCAQKI